MKYTMKINDERHRLLKILDIFSCMLPFSRLTNQEKLVYVEYIKFYLESKEKLSNKEIVAIFESYEFKRDVSIKVGEYEGKNVDMNTVANILTKLRKKGLLEKNEIPAKIIKLFSSISSNITFELIKNDNI